MYKIGIKVKQTFSEGSTHALCKKVSVFGVFLVRVFPHSDGIRRDLRVQLQIQSISPYSERMRENTDQKNSKYGHFSHSDDSYKTFSDKNNS